MPLGDGCPLVSPRSRAKASVAPQRADHSASPAINAWFDGRKTFPIAEPVQRAAISSLSLPSAIAIGVKEKEQVVGQLMGQRNRPIVFEHGRVNTFPIPIHHRLTGRLAVAVQYEPM